MHMLYATPIMRPCAEQVVCTSTLAIGSHTLAEHKAIVTRLSSIEERRVTIALCSARVWPPMARVEVQTTCLGLGSGFASG